MNDMHLLDTDQPNRTVCGRWDIGPIRLVNNLLWRYHRADALAAMYRIDPGAVMCPTCIVKDVERRAGVAG